MKLIAYSFTDSGFKIGKRLLDIEKLDIDHIDNKELEGGVKAHLETAYKRYDGIIFIAATGIAVRYILPYIKNKYRDLPIVVIDDMGKFSISLLSGHVGGSNYIANTIASSIGAIPVITTASDNRGFEAIDSFAKKHNYYIEDKKYLTIIMAMMVNGKKIGVLSDGKIALDYPNVEIIKNADDLDKYKNIEALITIDGEIDEYAINALPYINLKRKDINIGIGCKKGIEGDLIIKAIEEELKALDFPIDRIKSMGTIDVKKDEKGIIEASRYFKCPLEIFTVEDIKPIEEMFEKSEFVKKTIGVYSVSEPSAYLLGGELLVKKAKHKGITISISKE